MIPVPTSKPIPPAKRPRFHPQIAESDKEMCQILFGISRGGVPREYMAFKVKEEPDTEDSWIDETEDPEKPKKQRKPRKPSGKVEFSPMSLEITPEQRNLTITVHNKSNWQAWVSITVTSDKVIMPEHNFGYDAQPQWHMLMANQEVRKVEFRLKEGAEEGLTDKEVIAELEIWYRVIDKRKGRSYDACEGESDCQLCRENLHWSGPEVTWGKDGFVVEKDYDAEYGVKETRQIRIKIDKGNDKETDKDDKKSDKKSNIQKIKSEKEISKCSAVPDDKKSFDKKSTDKNANDKKLVDKKTDIKTDKTITPSTITKSKEETVRNEPMKPQNPTDKKQGTDNKKKPIDKKKKSTKGCCVIT